VWRKGALDWGAEKSRGQRAEGRGLRA